MSFKLTCAFLVGFLFACVTSFAQVAADHVYTDDVEIPAVYPGGMNSFLRYLEANKRYPDEARQKNINGRVYLSFIIEKDGNLSDIKILHGLGYGCDEEAIRLIKASIKWTPARQNDVVVRQIHTASISFGSSTGQPSIVRVKDVHLNSPNDADIRIDEPMPNTDAPRPDVIYTSVEQSAQFPGGVEALMNYLAKSVKYPAEARQKGIAGKVIVSFVVEKDGALTNVKVIRGIGSGCDEEALKAVKASGKWLPGKVKNQAVRQQYTFPVSFGDNIRPAIVSTPPNPAKENMIYTVADQDATYPGGPLAFVNYLSKNIRYPATARASATQGKVFVTFVIERDGTLSDVKVLRGVRQDIDEEAIRVVKASGKWLPGKFRNAAIRQQYTAPVSFDLL